MFFDIFIIHFFFLLFFLNPFLLISLIPEGSAEYACQQGSASAYFGFHFIVADFGDRVGQGCMDGPERLTMAEV